MARHPNLAPRDGCPPARARGSVAPRLVPVLRVHGCAVRARAGADRDTCRRRDPGTRRGAQPADGPCRARVADHGTPRGHRGRRRLHRHHRGGRRGAGRRRAHRRAAPGGMVRASRGRSTRACAPRRRPVVVCLDADVDPSPHLLARLGQVLGRAGRARLGAAVPRDAPLVGARRGVLQPRRGDGGRARRRPAGAGPGPRRVRPVPDRAARRACSPTSTTGPCGGPSSRTSRSRGASPPRDQPVRSLRRRRPASRSACTTGRGALVEGFTKNFAAGATTTPIPRLVAIVVWVTRGARRRRRSVRRQRRSGSLVYAAFALQCFVMLRQLGNFGIIAAALYPVLAVVFVAAVRCGPLVL